MKFLFNEFISIVQQQEGCDASNYRVHRPTMRLKTTYTQLVFHMRNRCVLGEIVFSEDNNFGNIAEESICEDDYSSDTDTGLIHQEVNLQSTSSVPNSNDDQFNIRSLYHTAMFLHEKIEECKPFYDAWPPSPSEICIKSAEKIIPPSLAAFLSWLLGFTTDVSINAYSSLPEEKYLKILSIAQDKTLYMYVLKAQNTLQVHITGNSGQTDNWISSVNQDIKWIWQFCVIFNSIIS